jgi:cytoskeletal protein CcmA (bactofilin family)
MAYIGVSPSNGIRRVFTYTATANQTSFSGVGAENITLSYKDANYVDVYQNGVKLASGDYTATSGTAIVLGTGATVNDMVVIVVFDVFSAADTVSKADGGQFDGNVTMAGTLGVTGVLTGTSLDISGDIDVDGTTNLDNTDIDGTLNVQGETTLQTHLNMGDNDKIKLGTSQDLEIYHDGNDSNVADVGTGTLLLKTDGAGIYLQKGSSETLAQFKTDAEVNLYYDNSKKFETTSSGVDITGGFTATDGCTITTANNLEQLTLISTDTDANQGPVLRLRRDSANPADNDIVGYLIYSADNDAGQITDFAGIRCHIDDVSDGTEDGNLKFFTNKNGTEVSRMGLASSETVFNEDSVDVDFRVESDGNQYAIFLEGSTSKIGIGTSTPQGYLTIDHNGSGAATPHIQLRDASDAREAFIVNQSGDLIMGTANSSDDTIDSSISIGTTQIIIKTNGSNNVRVLASGNVGIGTDQDAHGLTIFRHLQSYGGIMIQNGTNNTGQIFQAFHNYNGDRIGSISQNNSAVVYNTSSDYRLKENVSYTFDATSRLKQLKPARFNWISDDTNTTIDGFLAHEVSGIVPEAITGEKDGTQDLGTVKDADGNVIETNLSETFFTERKKETVDKDGNTEAAIYPSDYTWTKTGTENVYQGIDQAKLVPLLTKALQEQQATIEALTARIVTLENA